MVGLVASGGDKELGASGRVDSSVGIAAAGSAAGVGAFGTL